MSGSIRITAMVRRQAVIAYTEFPQHLQAHLARNTNTQAIEAKGAALRASAAIVWADLEVFINEVCEWGGYSGISGRVLKRNTHASIKSNVESVISKLRNPPDLVGALKAMTEIKELGVSFASKHLRFLCPEYCPVLDSILSDHLFYERSLEGYKAFATTCNLMALELNDASIGCPFPGKTSWRPCDVEAALYAWVMEWV